MAKGTILAVTDKPHLEHTLITIHASKVFQQTYPVFGHGHPRRDNDKQTQAQKEDEEEEDNELLFSSLVSSGGYVGRVVMPIHCGAKWGEGEFLVMGQMRLGQPVLRCAPRYQEWLALTRRAQSQAQCILES